MQQEEVSDSHELLVADHAFLALVRFQPMARELRYVLVARDVAHQLERAADQAARLAKLGMKLMMFGGNAPRQNSMIWLRALINSFIRPSIFCAP